MAIANQTVLAVIPARGGSKGVAGKNLRLVAGQSLIAHAAQTAKTVSFIDACILSTDEPEIAAEGRRNGLDVPFMRPASLASDTASSVDMWRHAWLESERIYGRGFDISVLLEPTSPLRRPEDVTRTVSDMLDHGSGAAATVSRTPSQYSPHKTLTVAHDGAIGFFDRTLQTSQRQKIPPFYHRNGVCYAVRRPTLIDHGQILEHDCIAVIVDRPVVNIDEEIDLDLAEFWYARKSAATNR